jgi:probable HAF family extracellular repeat protein
VGRSKATDANFHAAFWQNNAVNDLGGTQGQYISSYANGINNSGQVVGYYWDGSTGETIPTLWQNGTGTNLVLLSGLDYHGDNKANAINDSGQVVGVSSATIEMGSISHATFWQNGIVTDLGTLSGLNNMDDYSYATDINNNGQVVGYALGTDYYQHAVIWQNGTITDLGAIGGQANFASKANAINDNGQVVGVSNTTSGLGHATLWENGTITDLGGLTPTGSSEAFDINNKGQVVGWSEIGGVGRATLWQNGSVIDLNTLIRDPNYEVMEATGINDHGQIVGIGYLSGDDDLSAFLLTPIPPSRPALIPCIMLLLGGPNSQ